MKKLRRLVLIVLLLSGTTVSAAEQFPAAKWAGVQSYDAAAIQKLDRFNVGQLIEIKFNYRHTRIRHLKPNWYQASLWSYTPAEKSKYHYVQVVVPKAALPTFKALPTKAQAGQSFVVYGQILQDTEASKFRFVRLIGTKLERDPAGNATVNW